ncbi:MAG TPA: hypothetical protein DCD97_07140 [Firmicutes bacterium]|nr:hypothetical protein [Bacillota bacterium]
MELNCCKQEEKLLGRIEDLRKQLNKNINIMSNTPRSCPKTYEISRELDRLIYQYMTRDPNTF